MRASRNVVARLAAAMPIDQAGRASITKTQKASATAPVKRPAPQGAAAGIRTSLMRVRSPSSETAARSVAMGTCDERLGRAFLGERATGEAETVTYRSAAL